MNLDGAVQALADRIGRPVIIFDADFSVAAFSVHEGEVDQARLAMILSRKSSAQAVRMIREHRVERARGAVLLPAFEGAPPRVVAPLRYEGLITGYASYLPGPDEDPAERDAPDVAAARDEIGTMLAARAAALQEDADQLVHLLTNLLDGDPVQRQEAAEELTRTGLVSASNQFSVMVFRAADDPSQTVLRAPLVLRKGLTTIPRFSSLKAVGALVDNEGVLVIPYEVSVERMRNLLADEGFAAMRGGGGSPVPRLADAHLSRRQARIALRATLHDPAAYGQAAVWDDLGLDRILLQLPLERLTLADLPDPVQRLLAATSGADLARTLEAYLDNGADAQRTAGKLHVHRSTLYYRLDRVRALIDVDLSDGTVRRELHTALRVAKLAGLA